MKRQPNGTPARDIPPAAYLLADHLDSALAAAEDLETAARAWPAHRTDIGHVELLATERRVIERMRAFEAVLITRVLKARDRARELSRTEAEFALMSQLFVGGTASLVDAIAELADASESDFDTGDCLVAYLRRRGIIDSEAADLPEGRTIAFDDGFLVAGRIALGPLAEMIIAFIEALDNVYDLYPEQEETPLDLAAPPSESIEATASNPSPAPQSDDDASKVQSSQSKRERLMRRLETLDPTPIPEGQRPS